MRRWITLGILLGAACTPAHSARPSALPIVGPDGSPALHVSCGAEEGRCYELAGLNCPTGYDIEPTRGPAGNFLVRCRAHAAAAPTFAASPTQALAPSPYALQETVQPWPGESLAPSPYRQPPADQYPPLAPGGASARQPPPTPPAKPAPSDAARDLGF